MKKLSLALLLSIPYMSFGMQTWHSKPEPKKEYWECPDVAATDAITLSDEKYDATKTKELFTLAATQCSNPKEWWPQASLQNLLDEKADPNARNAKGVAPLELAAGYRHSSIGIKFVKTLLTHGATPTRAALSAAIRKFYDKPAPETYDIVNELIKRGAPINEQDPKMGNTLLHEQLSHVSSVLDVEHCTAVSLLLKHKADTSIKNNDGQTAGDLWKNKYKMYEFTPQGVNSALQDASTIRYRHGFGN